MNKLFAFTILFVIFLAGNTFAQGGSNKAMNIVDVRRPGDTTWHGKGDGTESSVLATVIFDGVMQGKLIVYTDSTLGQLMNVAQLKAAFMTRRFMDTNIVMNKATHEGSYLVAAIDFDYYSVSRYRLSNPQKKRPGTAEYDQKVAIAGLRKAIRYKDHDKNQRYMGDKPLYWVRCGDLKKLLAAYCKRPAHDARMDGIFEKYFSR